MASFEQFNAFFTNALDEAARSTVQNMIDDYFSDEAPADLEDLGDHMEDKTTNEDHLEPDIEPEDLDPETDFPTASL